MSRRGNLNPVGNIFSPPNWEPTNSLMVISVNSDNTRSTSVPVSARAMLLTADVDMLVGLSTGSSKLESGNGTFLNAGEHWPATVLPISTAALKVHGFTGASGRARCQFLTHRTIEP